MKIHVGDSWESIGTARKRFFEAQPQMKNAQYRSSHLPPNSRRANVVAQFKRAWQRARARVARPSRQRSSQPKPNPLSATNSRISHYMIIWGTIKPRQTLLFSLRKLVTPYELLTTLVREENLQVGLEELLILLTSHRERLAIDFPTWIQRIEESL